MDIKIDILDTVIDNGRVLLSEDAELAKDGVSSRNSLIGEVEFECSERRLSREETSQIVDWCLNHCSHD